MRMALTESEQKASATRKIP